MSTTSFLIWRVIAYSALPTWGRNENSSSQHLGKFVSLRHHDPPPRHYLGNPINLSPAKPWASAGPGLLLTHRGPWQHPFCPFFFRCLSLFSWACSRWLPSPVLPSPGTSPCAMKSRTLKWYLRRYWLPSFKGKKIPVSLVDDVAFHSLFWAQSKSKALPCCYVSFLPPAPSYRTALHWGQATRSAGALVLYHSHHLVNRLLVNSEQLSMRLNYRAER